MPPDSTDTSVDPAPVSTEPTGDQPEERFQHEQKKRTRHVNRIMKRLNEEDRLVRYLFKLFARTRGVAYLDEIYQLTLQTEAAGGLMIKDGSRRRTPGGTFIMLAWDHLTHEERRWAAKRYVVVKRREQRLAAATEATPTVTRQEKPDTLTAAAAAEPNQA